MANPNVFLGQQNRRVETRAATMEDELSAWMRRFGFFAARQQRSRIEATPVFPDRAIATEAQIMKAPTSMNTLEESLRRILRKFGLKQLNRAGRKASEVAGGEWILTPEIRARFDREIEQQIRTIMAETAAGVRSAIGDVIAEAVAQSPRPSSGQVQRRLIVALTQDQDDREPILSHTRAQRIARTELARIENDGIAEGYSQAGIERVKWLARNDGRSGDRHHERMNRHKAITVEAMNGRNRSEWFLTPLGNRLPYPLWGGAPVKDVVNCRCTIIPA